MSGILNLLLAGAASVVKDAYFNLVTLLLNTSATNGAQNNTFLDSSTNNFTITRNGNTTQGTFTPFSQTGWGNYFDGSSATLISSGTPMPTSGDFTVECWIYPISVSGSFNIVWEGNSTSALGCAINSNGTITYGRVLVATDGTTSNAVNFNQWNHIAHVRSSGTLKIYINGVLGLTASVSTTYTSAAARLASDANNTIYYNGYISNFRVTNTVVYSSAFTPPTSPLTAISGTSILTAQSNRFLDNSGNNLTFTTQGTPSVQAFSPFAPTAAYDAAVVGGSGYFDGTGDSLGIASNSGFAVGTGNFTCEFWVYWVSDTANAPTVFSIGNVNSSGSLNIFIGGTNTLYVRVGAGGQDTTNSTSFNFLRNWVHVAIVRTSGSIAMYLNGNSVSVSSTGAGNSITQSAPYIGWCAASSGNGGYINAYISGLRFNNTAVYSSNFSVPTTPPSAITGTLLLTNFTNSGIYDSTAKNVLETVDNAQVSTTQAKWGTTSMYFDGTGDWLLIPNNQMLNLNADFTIDFWIYLNSTSGEQCIFHNHNSDNNGILISVNGGGAGKIRFGAGNGSSFYVLIDSSTAISASTWTYVACTRSGSTWTVYINGSSAGTATSSSNPTFSTSDSIQIGRFTSGTPNALNAYLDDFRITKYARTITTPTAAFPLQ
jgi:hypothetical protein